MRPTRKLAAALLPILLMVSLRAFAGADINGWQEDTGWGSSVSLWALIPAVIVLFIALAAGGHSIMIAIAIIIGATVEQWFGSPAGFIAGGVFLLWVYGSKSKSEISNIDTSSRTANVNDSHAEVTEYVAPANPPAQAQEIAADPQKEVKRITSKEGDKLIARDQARIASQKTHANEGNS